MTNEDKVRQALREIEHGAVGGMSDLGTYEIFDSLITTIDSLRYKLPKPVEPGVDVVKISKIYSMAPHSKLGTPTAVMLL